MLIAVGVCPSSERYDVFFQSSVKRIFSNVFLNITVFNVNIHRIFLKILK